MNPATSNLASRWRVGVYQGPSQNPTKKKSGRGPGLGELPKIWRFPFNISATAEASDFKCGKQLGFAKGHHKIIPREKVGVAMPWAKRTPQNWWFPFNISATTEDSDFEIGRQVGFAKAHHKIPPRRKKGVAPD